MAKRSQQTVTAAPAPPGNKRSTSQSSQVQSNPSKPKGKTRKKAKKENATAPQVHAAPKTAEKTEASHTLQQNARVTPSSSKKGKGIEILDTPSSSQKGKGVEILDTPSSSQKGKGVEILDTPSSSQKGKSVEILETPSSSQKGKGVEILETPSSSQKGKGIEILETPKQTNSNLRASTSKNRATAEPSPVVTTPAVLAESWLFAGPMLLNQTPKSPNDLALSVAAKISNLDNETFRLAAAAPVPISLTIERQFYESQLLLYVLENVRGEHKKRQNYHGELDQDETELRRSFVDKLAYICDFKKGGSTVTALALQKTYQGVTFWIAANQTVKPKVVEFLQQVLRLLKNVDSSVRETAETQLLDLIVPFNNERIDYYWSALNANLPLCLERLDDLEGCADIKPSSKELKVLKTLLIGLPKLSKTRVGLVRECFEARKRKLSAFETLAQLTASGNAYSKFFDDIRHLLGRLGEHLKAIKTIVSAALRFPAILDEFDVQVRASPPSRCYFQSSHSITLDGIAGRIFTKDDEITHYQEALEILDRTSNGALLRGLRQECLFKTRIHAELLLADFFYWHQSDFIGSDPYIGCSKPACFNCFQYILAHPGNFVLPACHNKLYLAWRTPDIVEDKVLVSTATKIREAITSKLNSNCRAELRRQIDGRYAKKSAQYDSVTGTSSSIQVDRILQHAASISEDEDDSTYASAHEYIPSRRDSPSQHLNKTNSEIDDSDNDLSWYQSRVAKIQLR